MDILFFVCIGLFFIIKLKNSIGLRKDDDEILEKTINEFSKKEKIIDVTITKRGEEKKIDIGFPLTDAEEKALRLISFGKDEFLYGVEDAMEIVSNLLSKKDINGLKEVLSPKLYNVFKKQIEELAEEEKSLHSEIISVISKKIESVKLKNNLISVDVTLETEQMNYVENKDKNVIFGSKKERINIRERWTFQRNVSQKETFWIIVNVIQS
jgi:predicted lipid-binding transport protein (Tim44 family)